MKLLFKLDVNEEKLIEFNDINFITGDRAFLQNFIGLSKFWLLDSQGNLIVSFEDLLLDVVINLSSNFNSLNKGGITQGSLFDMDTEWGRHLWFILENDNYRISFNNNRDMLLNKKDFLIFINDFVEYALKTIEYFYKGIETNPNYEEWKNEIYSYLK